MSKARIRVTVLVSAVKIDRIRSMLSKINETMTSMAKNLRLILLSVRRFLRTEVNFGLSRLRDELIRTAVNDPSPFEFGSDDGIMFKVTDLEFISDKCGSYEKLEKKRGNGEC